MRNEILDEVNNLHQDIVDGKQAISDQINAIRANRAEAQKWMIYELDKLQD